MLVYHQCFFTRYPVILREFSIRKGSGGSGEFQGGDGCIRRIEFRRPLKLSVLTERRALPPYGLAGGQAGERGLNLLHRRSGRSINLGGKNCLDVYPGVSFTYSFRFTSLFQRCAD